MAKLIVNPTSTSRREILLPRTLLSIGRDPSNDVVLPDAMVSRRHAVIEFRGSQFFVRDCNSSNGSLVNGDRVSERNLRDGDLLAIGTARLLFREEEPQAEAGAKVVQHPSAPRMHCPACRADHRPGDLYCRQCGGPLSENVPPRSVCSSCGTAVPLPARYCNACGSLLPSLPPLVQGNPLERTQPAVHAALEAPPVPAAAPDVPGAHAPAAPALRASGLGSSPPSRPPHAAGAAAAAASPLRAPASMARRVRPQPVPRADTFRHERDEDSGRRSTAASVPAAPAERLAAALVDAVLVGAGQIVLVSPIFLYWWPRELPSNPGDVPFLPILLSLLLFLLAALLSAVYFIYGWGVRGATPGKRLLGLAVEGDDGAFPIGASAAAARLVGYFVSGLALGIGFLMVAFHGRGLHDRIAGTRVVRHERS
jgi:uncharacterized RDD family membrane protein YckC